LRRGGDLLTVLQVIVAIPALAALIAKAAISTGNSLPVSIGSVRGSVNINF
jgi:hypothetical protein